MSTESNLVELKDVAVGPMENLKVFILKICEKSLEKSAIVLVYAIEKTAVFLFFLFLWCYKVFVCNVY